MIRSHLADLKAKDFFKVGWLADEQQVEGPAPAEVGHNDGVDWHGGEEVSPWGFKFLPPKGMRNYWDPHIHIICVCEMLSIRLIYT